MDRFIMSHYGTHVFLDAFVSEAAIPTALTVELEGITDISGINSLTKESKSYKSIDGDGFDSVAMLGQGYKDVQIQLVRGGSGDVYTGAVGTSTYTQLKNWTDTVAAAGESGTKKKLTYIKPRGGNVYEGIVYNVVPLEFDDGNVNTSDGQTYSVSVKIFGAGTPVAVTCTNGVFTIATPSSGGTSGGTGEEAQG